MPVIAFVSPKGGSGKSTSALLLSMLLAKAYDVTLLDADPNRPIRDWASGGNAPPRLAIMSDVEEFNISQRIEDAAAETPFVIVDLEGTAAKIVIHAISLADFIVIPTRAAHEDAKAASRAVGVIRQTEKITGSVKPHAVLMTRTSPMIRTRSLAFIRKKLVDANVPVLQTELNEREAFKAILFFQQTLDGLDPNAVPNLDKAKINVGEFAHEVIARLAALQGSGEENEDRDVIAEQG